MNTGNKFILALALFFVFGITLWAILAPKDDVSKRIYATLKEQEKKADLSFSRVSFEEIANGIKYWQLISDKAMLNKSTGVATLKTTSGIFYKNGRDVMQFISPAALWDMNKKEIYLDQPLGFDPSLAKNINQIISTKSDISASVFHLPRLSHNKGFWFKANNLSWKLNDQKLVCSGNILLKKGEVTGLAEKLQSDVDLGLVLLEGNPLFMVESPGYSPVTVEASQIQARNNEDIIVAQGSPKIFWEDAVIYAQFIKYLQKENRLLLDGRVKIIYKDIIAWGNRASYLTRLGRVEITGNAHAIQGENQLNGEKVIVLLKEKKVEVLGKGKIVLTGEELK